MGFADSLRAFQEKALLAANESVCNVFQEFSTSIVALSPTPSGKGGYSLGTIKNGWYPAIGEYDSTVGRTPDSSGASSLSRISATIATKPFYGKDTFLTLSNNVRWAYRAEVLGWPRDDPTNDTSWHWTGRIGPYAMVATSFQNMIGKYGA